MSLAGEMITVAAGQLTARLMNEAPATLAAIQQAIERAAGRRVDLLVLPECAYPAYLLGSVESYRAGGHLTSDEFVTWLCQQAARYRLHMVCGLVEDTGKLLHNSAVLIDDRGRVIGRVRKHFLWDMDHDWFSPGEDIRAFDSAIGRIGIAICAEARDPELVATLVADGAEIIAVPTCWVNLAREPGRYENPQPEFLIEARAREFGVPFVCADKTGPEMAVSYIGQSRIVRGDGSTAAEAPYTGEMVIAARLVRKPPRRVWIPEMRRTVLQSIRTEEQAAPSAERKITVAALPTSVVNQRFTGGMGESFFKPLAERGVNVLLMNMGQEEQAEQLVMLARVFDIHAMGFPARADVYELGPAKVGCISGQWLRSFAPARALALEGAEILMFFDAPENLSLLRARAVENRVFVLGASERSAVIIDPTGKVLAKTGPENAAEAVAEIDLSQASNKLVAPRTNIFGERRAALYRY